MLIWLAEPQDEPIFAVQAAWHWLMLWIGGVAKRFWQLRPDQTWTRRDSVDVRAAAR